MHDTRSAAPEETDRRMLFSSEVQQRPAVGYLLAIAATGLAVLFTFLLRPVVGPSLSPPFLLATALAALLAGRRAGVLTALLSVLALDYWFLPPATGLTLPPPELLPRLVVFLVVALALAWVAGTAHEERWLAQRRAKENEILRHVAEDAAAEAEAAAQEAADALSRQLEAERALRSSDAELADLFETAAVGLQWVGPDGTILRANRAELDMLGYAEAEYVGHNLAEFHADPSVVTDILSGERTARRPARLRRKDGRLRDVLIDSSPYRVGGELVHIRCFTRDVTAEKEAHEAVARLAAIVSSSGDAIIGKTLDGVVTSWNAAAERIFGYSAEEMIGQSVFRLIPPELHGAERELLDRLRRGEVSEWAEAERVRKDGARIWISLSVSPILDSSGNILGAASIKRDVTERRRTEAQIREGQERLRMAHEAARMGTWRWEVGTDRLSWDEGLSRLYGLAPGEQVRGYQDFMQRVHPDDRERVAAAVRGALEQRGSLDYEFRIVLPNGGVRWLADFGRVTLDPQGRPLALSGVCMDITERKAVEEHLQDTQRLQAAGQLAGGIAHEANNQMTVVLAATQFLLRRPDLPLGARGDVEYIRQAAERTASITQQLLAFSRRQLLQLQDVDLNRLVTSIEPVLRRSLAEHHELVLRLSPSAAVVRADPRQLEQVLLNLTLNARDAMPEGGRLTIETGSTAVEPEAGGPPVGGPTAGRYGVIVVTDTGQGMDEATVKRAFDPFFTTKPVGQGTGLGLSVAHGIVSQTGGHIQLRSEPAKGTSFRIHLPPAGPARPPAAAWAGEAAAASPGRVALVVEDDALVRGMARRGLSEAGYGTLEAAHGEAALELLRDHGGRVDVVVTDIGMPEMNGYELARRLREIRPGLPVVFISGYGDADPPGPFLQKPFAPDDLVRTVGEVLARSVPPLTAPR